MGHDIYFYEAFEEEEQSLRSFLPADINAGFTWKTIQEAAHDAPPAEIISTRTQSIYPPDWASRLRAILSRSTGYDHLLRYRRESGFSGPLAYLPLYCNRAVAEQALMLWLMLLRRMPRQMEQFARFERDGITGGELGDRTLAVYGVGNIGREVAGIGAALGMRVVGVDIVQRHKEVSYVTGEEAAAEADIIVAAMNLTPENSDYFDESFWRRCKKGVIFVNISRGELSPAVVLEKAMEAGIIGGLALDVFNHEKALAARLRGGEKNDDDEVAALMRLKEKDTVIMTPHNAFNTVESVRRKSQQSVEQFLHFRETGRFIWAV